MPQLILNKRYKILKKIGEGATGSVYKVRDLRENRIIALKILSKKKISSESVNVLKENLDFSQDYAIQIYAQYMISGRLKMVEVILPWSILMVKIFLPSQKDYHMKKSIHGLFSSVVF